MSYSNRSVSGTLAASGAGSNRPAGNCNETDFLILAHTLRGEGFDASEDGTGRGIPIVPVYSFSDKDNGRDVAIEMSPTLRTSSVHPAIAPTLTRYNLDSRSPQSEEQQKIVRSVFDSVGAVRRLTPRECERLQGFQDDSESAIIRVCCAENLRNPALVEMQNHKSRSAAGLAVAEGLNANALSADADLSVKSHRTSKHAEVLVEIDCEAGTIRITTPERELLEPVRIADSLNRTFLATRTADFARLIALTLSTLGQITPDGLEESPPITRRSIHLKNGKCVVLLSGQEIEESASDAGQSITEALECFRFITSEAGQSSLTSGLTPKTLCCSVIHAISSYIPEKIKARDSFDLDLRRVTPYTLVPYRNKPASDSCRYKALGNSMAVPCMSWIGKRIATVEQILKESSMNVSN